ncbi:MAG: hypothetical protein JSR46_10635 [Verrucomicrobia bacterium]|nr:hypothetical protein [Verrucomicrobiota bacterium]
MSHIKIPSWLELLPFIEPEAKKPDTDQHTFWKEQALRFGFDTRTMQQSTAPIDNRWKSFFFEKLFVYTLKKANWNLSNLKAWEKNFWKQNGTYIETLELHAPPLTMCVLETILQWLSNLKVLELRKCNLLMQEATTTGISPPVLQKLHTVRMHDLHIVSAKALTFIPDQINTIHLEHCRSLCSEFMHRLSTLKQLSSLTLKSCPTVEQCAIGRLPSQLLEVDLSGSGRALQPDSLALLPKGLQVLKLNGWDLCSDRELLHLPPHLHTLEIGGWSLTRAGLEIIGRLHLTHLNLTGCACDTFYDGLSLLPKTLISLNLSQNDLCSDDFSHLHTLESLQELIIEYGAAFDAVFDEPFDFPSNLNTLFLSHSGPLSKKAIESLQRLTHLKKLSLAACEIENSDLEWLPQNLEELDLSLCPQVSDLGLTFLINHSSLSSLTLEGCEQIRGSGFSSLCPSIKKLSLRGCNRLSGKSLVMLPTELEELFLDHCSLIATSDIRALPSTLQALTLTGCCDLTDEVIYFLSALPLLHTIGLQDCKEVSEESATQFFRNNFEGTIHIASQIEHHPPLSTIKKLTNFKAKIIQRFKTPS